MQGTRSSKWRWSWNKGGECGGAVRTRSGKSVCLLAVFQNPKMRLLDVELEEEERRGGERWGRVSDGSCVQEPKDMLLNVELEQNAENVDVDVGGRERERWGRVMHACWLRVLAACKGERGLDR